jgi:hypothetical protein
MRTARGVLVWLPTLSFLFLATALRTSAQATSTPEERMQWVEVTHKLESAPLDDSVNQQGEAAFKRLSDVHDVHVLLCPALGGWPRLLITPALPTQWVPRSFAFFAKGRVPRTSAPAKLRHSIPKRNLGPAFIHAHRSSFAQKIETITAPPPLLRCAD